MHHCMGHLTNYSLNKRSFSELQKFAEGLLQKLVHHRVVVSNIFYVHPYLGKWSNLTNIFEMGWNHQLDHDSCLAFAVGMVVVFFCNGWHWWHDEQTKYVSRFLFSFLVLSQIPGHKFEHCGQSIEEVFGDDNVSSKRPLTVCLRQLAQETFGQVWAFRTNQKWTGRKQVKGLWTVVPRHD